MNSYEDLKNRLQKLLPEAKLRIVRDSLLLENAECLPRLARLLKDSESFRYDYLSSVTGADYLDYLETVYHFYSIEKRSGPFVLRVRCAKADPQIPSIVSVYRGAEFQEREAYDMYGIIFKDHPDLRRLFMWEEFKGFPMRKDYEQEDSETLEMDDIAWCDKHGIKVPDEIRQKAEQLQREGKRAVVNREGKETS